MDQPVVVLLVLRCLSSVLPPNNIYCSIYSERFPRTKYPPASLCSCIVYSAAGGVSRWLSFGLVSVLKAVCHLPPVSSPFPCPRCYLPCTAPEFVQQCGELVSLLLTWQHQSSQLQVFSPFVSLSGLKICCANKREMVVQGEEQADWGKPAAFDTSLACVN